MGKRVLAVLVVTAAGVIGPVFAEGDPEQGRVLARTNCAHCHGVDGNARSTSFQPVPMLAGQPAVYLIQEMRNYLAGARDDSSKNAAMTRALEEMSDQDILDVAGFFAAQKRY